MVCAETMLPTLIMESKTLVNEDRCQRCPELPILRGGCCELEGPGAAVARDELRRWTSRTTRYVWLGLVRMVWPVKCDTATRLV